MKSRFFSCEITACEFLESEFAMISHSAQRYHAG
jgi:hypothetical protein